LRNNLPEEKKMKIGIIGKGNVGTALANGLSRAGHQIKFGHRDPQEPVKNAIEWGEVIILAIPHESVKETVMNFGSALNGKILIDVTNLLDDNMELLPGYTISGAEEIQKLLPNAYVVKAFNTVFAKNQSSGHIHGTQLTAFVAGDNQKAKKAVMQLTKDVGFEPVDCGPLRVARYLEPMGILIISLAFKQKMGIDIGYSLIKG
jgi:predicted dinucleotide-binding enzyme